MSERKVVAWLCEIRKGQEWKVDLTTSHRFVKDEWERTAHGEIRVTELVRRAPTTGGGERPRVVINCDQCGKLANECVCGGGEREALEEWSETLESWAEVVSPSPHALSRRDRALLENVLRRAAAAFASEPAAELWVRTIVCPACATMDDVERTLRCDTPGCDGLGSYVRGERRTKPATPREPERCYGTIREALEMGWTDNGDVEYEDALVALEGLWAALVAARLVQPPPREEVDDG